jgi:hypothetical protein
MTIAALVSRDDGSSPRKGHISGSFVSVFGDPRAAVIAPLRGYRSPCRSQTCPPAGHSLRKSASTIQTHLRSWHVPASGRSTRIGRRPAARSLGTCSSSGGYRKNAEVSAVHAQCLVTCRSIPVQTERLDMFPGRVLPPSFGMIRGVWGKAPAPILVAHSYINFL